MLILACATQYAVHAAENARVFGDAELLPAWLAAMEFEMTVTADSVEWRGTEFRHVHAPMAVSAGALAVKGARAEVAGGGITLDLRHEPAATTRVYLRGTQVQLGEIEALAGLVQGAPVDFALDLTGTGATPRAIAASANGRLTTQSTAQGRVRRSVERAIKSVFATLIAALNPLRSADDAVVLECVAADLSIAQGRIEHRDGIAFLTQRMRVAGSGSIDLGREEFALVFKPETRGGVNLKGLTVVESARLDGSFSAPRVQLDSGNPLERAANLGASVAVIGGNALMSALGNKRPNDVLCPK